MLPIEEKYLHAFKIQVRDQRAFGRKPVVGSFVLENIESYLVDTPAISSKPGTPPEPAAPPSSSEDQQSVEASAIMQAAGASSAPPTSTAAAGEQQPKNEVASRDELDSRAVAPAAVCSI